MANGIFQVARVHRLGKRQVLADQEPHHFAVRLGHPDSLHGDFTNAQGNVDVAFVRSPLADVVIEQREVERRRIFQLREQLGVRLGAAAS